MRDVGNKEREKNVLGHKKYQIILRLFWQDYSTELFDISVNILIYFQAKR